MVRGSGIGFILNSSYFALEKPVRVRLTQQFVRTLQIPFHFFSLDCLLPIININLSWIMVIYPSWLYIEFAELELTLASFLPNYSCLRVGQNSRLILLLDVVGVLSSGT